MTTLDLEQISESLNVISRVVIGYTDGKTGRHVNGVADKLDTIAKQIALRNAIDSWILRVVCLITLLRFFGWEHAKDLATFFGGHL